MTTMLARASFLLNALLLLLSPLLLNAQSGGTDDAILQGFYWNTNPGDFASNQGVWWDTISTVAPDLADGGIQTVWTPPANKGFAGTFDMGYGVYDYYDFGSFFQKGTLRTRHGNAGQFFNAIDVLHQNGLKVMGDLVLNHRAGAESTQPEACDHENDGILENRFTRFRPASGRAPMNAEDFHPTNTHCDLFGPYHDRVFFEDLCYFEGIDQVLDPNAPNNGWYHGPHNLGRAGDSLIVWGRYLLDEVGFDELRLDAVKHIEPGFMAPFLVEMAAGDQPFAVGELFDGDIGTLKGYRDQVESFNSTFGTGGKNANLAIFDFNLRFAIRDFCNNTSGSYDMWNLNNAGLLFNGMPGEDIVNFVENHDFDRIGYVTTDCSDPDVVAQEGSTCLKFSIDSGHDPVVSDKHIGYAYITAAEGRPSIFWKDWFWFGLKDEIKWQLALRSAMASGSTTPITFLNPFFVAGNGGDLFVLNRNGDSGQGGLVLTLNDSPNTENIAFINTPFSNMELKDYSDAYMFTQTTAFGDSRAQVKALPRNYAWYAPTGRYPTPPDAAPTAFTLGSHEGAKLHFVAIRAADAANLLVNGAPIEAGDQIAVQPAGGGDAVGLGRIGQSFEWDGVHDIIIEVLGGGNTTEAKGALVNGDGFELVVFDKSTGTTEVAASIEFAADNTNFTFNPLRPSSKGGAFNLTATHSTATYQVGAISLITGLDTRALTCAGSEAADSAYDDGWQTNDADGSGFGPWTLVATSNAGHFAASSAGNGDGDSNGDGDIDTGGRAWGMFANSGGEAVAIRDFNNPMDIGHTFSLSMDNGFVDGAVGFRLRNINNQEVLRFYFEGGDANYTLLDGNGEQDTGVPYTDEGLNISVTLTGSGLFDFQITPLESGTATTLSGTFINTTATNTIHSLSAFNQNAGFNAPANLYFNNFEICRPPTCIISDIQARSQTVCNPVDNTYSQWVTVFLANDPPGPINTQISVNGVTEQFSSFNSFDTVLIQLTGLISDGQEVDVTAVITGSAGCTVTENALFTAPADCQPPTIVCPENITVNTDPGVCNAVVSYDPPQGTDNLPGANTFLADGTGSGEAFSTGTTTELYRVIDAAGNEAGCSFTVTVEDKEAPTFTCPEMQTRSVDANCNYNVEDFTSLIDDAMDNCSSTFSIVQSPTAGQIFNGTGNTVIQLTVFDAAGNHSECDMSLILKDDTPPSVSCPGTPTDALLGSDCQVILADYTVFATTTDNCDGAVDLSQSPLSGTPVTGPQELVVTITATDNAGLTDECTYTINISDNVPPTPDCPQNITIDNAPGQCGANVSFTLPMPDDNCGNATATANPPSGSFFPTGTTTVTVTANDGNNTDDCTFTVTVNDTEPPVANCTDATVALGEDGTYTLGSKDCGSITDASMDNCPDGTGPGELQPGCTFDGTAVLDCSDLESGRTITLTIADLAGNEASCDVHFTVIDETPPTAVCQSQTVTLDDDGQGSLEAIAVDNGSTDNCNIISYSLDRNTFTCADVGPQQVTLTVTDQSGHSDQCTANVTVEDNAPPVAVCQHFTAALVAPGTFSLQASDLDGGSSTACGSFSLSIPATSFGCEDIGQTIPVELTVTDDSNGQTDKCTAQVAVTDPNGFCCAAPEAVCASTTIYLDEQGSASIAPADIGSGSTADCGLDSESLSQETFDCEDLGPNTVTYTITDINQNSDNCTATVTVQDNLPPVATCLTTTIELQPDGTYALQESDVYDAANSTDNCGISQISFPPITFGCADTGQSFSIPVMIADASGNTSSCTASVQVTIGNSLPAPWTGTDIGSPGAGSSYTYDPCAPGNGAFEVGTGGYNLIPNTTDNIAFTHVPLCGNGGIQARIDEVSNGYAGLMIRESNAPGAKMTAIYSNLTNLLRRETRSVANGPRSSATTYASFPTFLRLVRQGDWIRGFYKNSSNWILFHQVYLPMDACVEMGLAVFTTDPSGQADATFSKVNYLSGSSLSTPGSSPTPETLKSRQQASIAPNPFSHEFTLTFERPLENTTTAVLRNELGQILQQLQLPAGAIHHNFDGSDLPRGLYFLEVRDEQGNREVLKVVRQ